MSAKPNRERTWAVIAASGTAGHSYPGIAVAQELVRHGKSAHFAVSSTGVGARGVEQAGFDCDLISGRGLQRSLSPRAIAANLTTVFKLASGMWQLLRLLRRHHPRVLLATGGYTGLMAAVAAFVLRIPIVAAEQNAVPGLANKITARLAAATAVSFDDTDLPKSVTTGNPVRSEILDAAQARQARVSEAEAEEETAGRTLRIAVLGGSLGATAVNQATADLLAELESKQELNSQTAAGPGRSYDIFHATGQREWDQWKDLTAECAAVSYRSVPFADNMAEVLEQTDLVVGRAGAGTTAELAVMGLPSILIPLPGAPGDHQTANAKVLERAGAGICLPQKELSGAKLLELLEELRGDRGRLQQMSQAAAALAKPQAAENIAQLLFEHAKSGT